MSIRASGEYIDRHTVTVTGACSDSDDDECVS